MNFYALNLINFGSSKVLILQTNIILSTVSLKVQNREQKTTQPYLEIIGNKGVVLVCFFSTLGQVWLVSIKYVHKEKNLNNFL